MIIAFTSLTPAGATFMDWSWHWLKGEDQHWNKKHGWSDLTKNPLSKNNSHSHKKNHPCSLEEWNKFIDSAMAENADVSFYPVLLSKNNNLSEYVKQINLLVEQGIEVVVLKQTKEFPYGPERTDKIHSDDLSYYFNTIPELRKGHTRKKIREIVSLKMRFDRIKWLEKIESEFKGLDNKVIVVTDDEWIDQTEESMLEIFQRTGVKISDDRLEHWRVVTNKWRKIYKKTETFYTETMPEIVDKIVAGEDMDLTQFDFGFTQESLLMALTLTRHRKRIVLPDDHFPMSTKELHKFLK